MRKQIFICDRCQREKELNDPYPQGNEFHIEKIGDQNIELCSECDQEFRNLDRALTGDTPASDILKRWLEGKDVKRVTIIAELGQAGEAVNFPVYEKPT